MPMSDFLVKRNDLRECRIVESGVPERAWPDAASGRQLRADREQRDVCGARRDDVLLGLLSSRERLGSCPDVGLRPGGAKRRKGRRAGDALLRIPSPLVLPCRDPRPSRRGRLRRRLDASGGTAADLSALPGHRRRSFLPCGHRGSADVLRPLFFTSFLIGDQLVGDGSPARADRDLERLEQDRNRSRLPSGATRGSRADRADLCTQRRVRRRPRRLRPHRNLRRDRIPRSRTATFVDIAGDATVRLAVHSHYAQDPPLQHESGGAHWEKRGDSGGELPRAVTDPLLRPRSRQEAL